jgi:hypothetical protein
VGLCYLDCRFGIGESKLGTGLPVGRSLRGNGSCKECSDSLIWLVTLFQNLR